MALVSSSCLSSIVLCYYIAYKTLKYVGVYSISTRRRSHTTLSVFVTSLVKWAIFDLKVDQSSLIAFNVKLYLDQ